jgi:hypothetical protein
VIDTSDGMAGAGNAGEPRGRGPTGGRGAKRGTRAAVDYLRANPQVFVLLVICVVLGLGTFLAVVFGLLTAGSGQSTGEPSGAIIGTHALTLGAQALIA